MANLGSVARIFLVLHALLILSTTARNQCTMTNCRNSNDNSCDGDEVTFNFWENNPVNNSPIVLPDGRIQMVPDRCDPPFQHFDGRCWAYSMGILGVPTNRGGYGEVASTIWSTAEAVCSKSVYGDDVETLGGSHLASIHTLRENCFVQEILQTHSYFWSENKNNGLRAFKDKRGFNDYHGCHSNNQGKTSITNDKGTCWIGLDQKPGADTAVLDYSWNDFTIYDKRPQRNQGFTPWAGDAGAAACWSATTGNIQTPCGSYFEPNNVAGGTEDCIQIWDRENYRGEWNDEPCSTNYPYVCNKIARCQPGYFRSQRFKGMPVRWNQTWTDWGIDRSYTKGACTQCPAGTYHPQDSKNNYEASCFPCDPGYYGYPGETKSTCRAPCPVGSFCEQGTSNATISACPEGTYSNATGLSSVASCLTTPAGSYSVTNSTSFLPCFQGFCSGEREGTIGCSSACPQGYFCPSNTRCFGVALTVTTLATLPKPCGSINLYSGAGQSACTSVSQGFYTVGGNATTRTGQDKCPAGYWCSGGALNPCDVGTFNDRVGSFAKTDCRECSAGYYCPLASTSPTQEPCFLSAPSPNGENKPAKYFCPAGAKSRMVVGSGNYSTPTTPESLNTRTAQLACNSSQICIDGVAFDKITWDAQSCSALSVAENNLTPTTGRLLSGVLNSNLVGYNVTYKLVNFTLGPDLQTSLANGPCDPTTNAAPYSNAGIFAVDLHSGEIQLTRTTFPYYLDYEPTNATGSKCPTAGIRYALTVSANATGEGTQTIIQCTIPITVLDRNDQPQWLLEMNKTTYYRTMPEKALINTAVSRCDSIASSFYGCPVVHPSGFAVELKAVDQEYFSVLRYSFVLGVGSAAGYTQEADNPFRINSCSGLITMRNDREIDYFNNKTFNFTVRVTDDGNGGQFEALTADVNITIFITDSPDPPVLANPSNYNFVVYENLPAGQIIGSVIAFDPDIGSEIKYRLVEPIDGDAFYMDENFVIRTSDKGATSIDFESTKTIYTINVLAYDCTPTCPGLSDQKSYTITVLNTNDPPRFIDVTDFYIAENSNDLSPVCFSGTGVCPSPNSLDRVKSFDIDGAPITPGDDTVFSITTVNSPFEIDSTTGQIRTKTGSKSLLNFEDESLSDLSGTGRSFRVTVRITSTGSGAPVTGQPAWSERVFSIYLVDVNEAPVVSFVPQYFVLETAPVGSTADPEIWNQISPAITWTDPDNADILLRESPAPMQSVSFSRLTSVQHPLLNDSNALFSVFNLPNGAGAGIDVLGTLDFETAPTGGLLCGTNSTLLTRCYIIPLRATDNGNPPLFADVNVTVRIVDVNDGPAFAAPLTVTLLVSENVTSGAQQVSPGTYKANDADSAELNYTIVSGSGASMFDVVSGCSGSCFTVNKKADVVFDFESSQTKFSLEISATDGHSSKLIGAGCSYVDGVYSGCNDGTRCSTKTGPFRTEYRCFEFCRPTSDHLTIPRRDVYFCDYSAIPSGSKDPIGPAFEQFADTNLRINIDITDWNDAPYIIGDNGLANGVDCLLNTSVTFQKQNTNQIALTRIRATDVDVTYAHAPFTFEKTNPDDEFWQTFDLDNATGQIGIFPTVEFGNNTNKFLTLGQVFTSQVTVLDQYPFLPEAPRMSSTCEVIVTVVDFNNRPVLQSPTPVGIMEGTALGTVVYDAIAPNFTAVDPDVIGNPADVLTFSMSVSPFFTLNSTSSRLTLSGQLLDYETLSPTFQQVLIVRVLDSKGADDVETVVVNVLDRNEAPVWTSKPLLRTLPENSPAGFRALDLRTLAIDPDIYANNVTTFSNTSFSIVSGCGASCPFTLASPSTNGSLIVKPSQTLNYESATKSWTFVVRATDGGNATLFDDVTLTLSLTDVNEPPSIVSGLTFLVPEGSSNTFLTDLSSLVSDPDAADTLPNLQINITAGDPSGIFTIVQSQLFVAPSSILDFENVRAYTLSITVRDTGNLTAVGTFQINVTNVNDVTVSSIALVSGTTLNCGSTTRIRITGTNFGMVSKSPAATVLVQYTRPVSTADPSPPTRNATNCSITSVANTEIQCDMPSGAGMNFVFSVSITVPALIVKDTRSNVASTLVFSAPTLTSVTNVTALPTRGQNATFTLTGTCFGALADNVTFGSPVASAFSFVELCDGLLQCAALSRCSVVSATSITCLSIPPGLGSNLKWRVRVLGQTVVNSLSQGAYGIPALTASSITILPTNGAPASPYFVFNGTNFGPLDSVPDAAYFTYLSSTYNFQQCKVTIAFTQVTCRTSDPGIGANMRAFISFGNQLSSQSSFLLNFAAATISLISGQGASGAATIGGQFVTLTGTSFGPICGLPGASIDAGGVNCAFVSATYRRGSVYVSTGLPIVYTAFPCAVVSQNQIVCATAPGTGAGHTWTVTIGGQAATVSPTAGTTSYGAPVVATYDGVGATNAKTNGGQSINIQGSNFGPVGGALVVGQYGNKDINPTEFTAESCIVTVAHTTITCILAQGAGLELSWVVTVDGTLGRNELTKYGAPQLLSTTFDTTNSFLNNDGGNSVIITGLNFGPAGLPGPYLNYAYLGPPTFPNAYPVPCTVVDHTSMACTIGAGSGSGMRMIVSVKNQQSALSSFAFNYRSPDVTGGLLPPGALKKTDGGATLFIRGRGYSLCDPKSSIKILWNEDNTVLGATNRALEITGTFNDDGTVQSPPCPLVNEYAQISFIVPEMNMARLVNVYVQVTTSAYGGSIVSSDSIHFMYDEPILSSIFAEASAVTFGGVRVSMFGSNFCKSESCCRTILDNLPVPLDNIVSHSHSRIVFETIRPGTLFVRCGSISSNALNFTANSPFVFGTVPQLNQKEFKPPGNETFEVWGLYFGDTAPNVTIADNVTLQTVSYGAVDCNDPSRPQTAGSFAFDSGAQCYKIVVRTPAMTGRNLPLNVIRGATKSLADDARFEFLSFALPVVDIATGNAASNPLTSIAGDTLTLVGKNFGTTQGQILIGNPADDPILCTVVPGGWNDSVVTCNVGPGEGRNLSVTIIQASGDSVVTPIVTISYLPPSQLSFNENVLYPTEGGAIFELAGLNFGRPNKGVVTIGGRQCARILSNASYVQCSFPEGEGFNLPVVITVGGQSATAVRVAAYAPPEIYAITPSSNLPTAGGPVVTIIGKNFGINQLKLFFGAFTVAERFLSPDSSLHKDPFIYPGTNHTTLMLELPPFFGALRVVTLSVRNQLSTSSVNISFAAPEIGNVSVLQEDGFYTPPFFTSSDLIFPDAAFTLNGSSLPPASRRRLRSLAETGYGLWTSKSFGPCESNSLVRNMFWKSFTEISSNGDFRRTFNHFDDGICSSPGNQSFVIRVEGKFIDLGIFAPDRETSACGLSRLFSQTVSTVRVTILTADALDMFLSRCSCVDTWQIGVPVSVPQPCLASITQCPLLATLYGEEYSPGQTRFGVYVVSNDVDIFMSKTSASQIALEARQSLKFPDSETASVQPQVSQLVANIPKGPTDGCYSWEPIRDFLERAAQQSKLLGLPISEIPRNCFQRALMEVTGSNFGLPLTTDQLSQSPANEPPSLRVFLVSDDPTVLPFEASTVASKGNHGMFCPFPDCLQTDKRIRFWIPYGLGKSLRIHIFVGDQGQFATTRFSYLPPRIEELNPGTVRLGRQFQNARGENIVVRGFNFGGRSTVSNVLISGRPCKDPTWTSGTSSDPDGRPYITCSSELDVVGPKSVLVCVAGQLTFGKVFRTDGPVLLAGEAQNAWNVSKPFPVSFSRQLQSLALSRCPATTTGRLYELCVDCPLGASCEDGAFGGPKSDQFFFDYEVPVRNPDGTVTDRARQLCTNEAWNETYLDLYPDLVQRETCNAFVGCEPKSACLGNSLCSAGYEYSYPTCMVRRGYTNATSFSSLTRAQVANTPNSCNVTLNPYTFEYEGVDQDCRGTLAPGQTCGADEPESCSKCTVFKDGDNSYFGACECALPARCSLCTVRTHFRLNNECVPCPQNPGLLIGGLFAAAIAVVIVGWYLQRENVNLAFITIGIDYFQVLAIFASTKVPWPGVLQSLFNIMSVFNFNIDITAPECLAPNLDYEVKWWLQMALPLALFGVLASIYFGYMFLKMFRWGIYQSHVYTSHLSALVAIFMIAMYYLYLVLTKKALEIFNCNPVDPDDGFTYTAFTSLHCDGGGLCRCGEPGGPQMRLYPFAIVFLILYTFGYPAYIAFVLRKFALLVREDQYLRAYEVGYVRKTNPDCYDMRKRYSKLYYQFKPRYAPFWILVLLIRKFWIAFAFILFRGNPSFQLAVVLLVLFTSIVFQVLWRPFLSTADRPGIVRELDSMAERSIKEPVFAEYREIQKRVQECMTLDVEHRRRIKQTKQGAQLFSGLTSDAGKNLGMSLVVKPTQKVSRSVAAARWFTNLNTLEFILLGCGIIVCLAGIMFEASARDNRALVRGQVDSITYIVAIVVVSSLVYYFLFFLAEVSPAAISTLLSLCKKKDKNEKDEYYDPNINLEENPMFAAPKVEFADNRMLQAELDQQLAQLKLAEQQNKRLREDLKNKKMEAQLDETANAPLTGLEDVKPKAQRKDFAQTRLNAALVGPNRQRARGTKKAVEEEEQDPENPVVRASGRASVFSRMSIAFKRPQASNNKTDDEA